MEDIKYAIITSSNKSKEGLPVYSLNEKIEELTYLGYKIIDNRHKVINK